MTQIAGPETVVGDFDDVDLEVAGRRYHLERRDDEFWVRIESEESGGARDVTERRIALATGSHRLQLYWLAAEQGRKLDVLPFHYLIPEKRWIPRDAFFINPPGASSPDGGDWNATCVQCHTTGPRPRAGRQMADTQVGEFGIACESCHGPGARHVERQRSPLRRYANLVTEWHDETIIDPANLDHQRASEVCGQCHSFWTAASPDVARRSNAIGFDFRPGGTLAESKRVLDRSQAIRAGGIMGSPLLVNGSWWPDGTVRVAGRELGGLVESPCYERGEMSCLSCHRLHQGHDDERPPEEWANDLLREGMRGDAACLQCHESFSDRIEAHTHHSTGSEGSRCQNCHMSYTTYGLLKTIRSHRIDSPRVRLPALENQPNACNQCHLDRTLAWSARHLEEWYDQTSPSLSPDENAVADSILRLLQGDAGQRVLMAWSMGWAPAREASGEEWMAPYLAQLLLDPYSAVRFIAWESLASLEGFGSLDYDFIGDEDERQAAMHAVLEEWNRRDGGAAKAGGTSVLIDDDGRLERDRVAALLAERDDRPVSMVE
jgi:hypothetical protein